jgi:hypothetical protein
MTAPTFDPYAPPAAPIEPAAGVEGTLPPGVRRYRLDPARFRALATRLALRRLALVAVLPLGVALLLATGGERGFFVPVVLLGVGWSLFIALAKARSASAPELVSYEMLAGPRVLRRTMIGRQPAEVLRPEVSAVFEVKGGLWVACSEPRRAVFVSRAVDGYDDLRATLAAWRPIEPLRGWAAWRFGVAQASRQAPRGAVTGTALASDASLFEELERVRAASSAAWTRYPAVSPVTRYRAVMIWVLLIVMFLAIWQVLQPGERRPPPRRDVPAESPS